MIEYVFFFVRIINHQMSNFLYYIYELDLFGIILNKITSKFISLKLLNIKILLYYLNLKYAQIKDITIT